MSSQRWTTGMQHSSNKDGDFSMLNQQNYYERIYPEEMKDISYFKCQYCPYSTPKSGNLKTHLRKHTGERPYICRFCPYRAAQRSSFRYHMQKHHPMEFRQ